MLHTSNLIKESDPKTLPDLKALDENWKNKSQLQKETIEGLSKIDWEAVWKLLVKPHSQIMTLNCSLDSVQRMLPPLHDAIFVGKLRTQFGMPPQVRPTSEICELRGKAGNDD